MQLVHRYPHGFSCNWIGPGCDEALLERALKPNPAGNANERTPLVLVRPN